jgi:putative ABC transport system substrate-binding protein
MLAVDLGQKRLELLLEVVPTATTIAALVNPGSPGASILLRDLQSAANALGAHVQVVHASSEGEFEAVFSEVGKLGAKALLIGADPLFNNESQRLAALALHHAIPAIYQFHEFAEAGGLMSYGGSIADTYRQAGIYTGRIVGGETPGNLPVHQSAKVDFIVNLRAATALGLTIPPSLLARADEVIE